MDAANLVRDSYWTLLSEQPDPVASQFWHLQVQDGLPASQLKVAFLSSDEYFRQQGGDLGSWVSAVYRDALGRIPDQSDVAYWQDQVNNGLTLTGAAAAIVTSTEAEQLADQADQLRQLWHGDTQSSASPATHSGPVRNLVSASRIRYFSAPLSELEIDAWMRFYVLARSS